VDDQKRQSYSRKNGLEGELIMSSRVVQAMLAKDIPISEIAIPEVIQANLAGADLCDARRSRRMTDKKETSGL